MDELGAYSRYWWLVALLGVLTILFGVAVIVWPAFSMKLMIGLFGVCAVLFGVVGLVAALRAMRRQPTWYVYLVAGLASALTGIVALVWPVFYATILLLFFAIAFIITGAMLIVAGIMLRSEMSYEWLLIAGGTLEAVFGIFILLRPQAGVLALAWLIGSIAILVGIVYLVVAVAMRTMRQQPVAGIHAS